MQILLQVFSYKISKYALIGVISTFLHATVASAYLYFIYDSLLQSNIIGFFLAYFFSYLMQSKYVFKHAYTINKALKYFIVQFGSLLSSIALTNLFANFNSYIKTAIVIAILPLITYTVHYFWTFKTKIKKEME